MENERIRKSLQEIIEYLEHYEEKNSREDQFERPKKIRFSSIRDVVRELNAILNSLN
ncbi:hypothetical protein [Legionella jamestowniensis]|uniref:Uncharacterized protein n=1 Tax=Legionella jamestowniensis TaxID=455 RepID=A0A0W0UHS5_9GAMM|nr:hypothetical protein [Legionella jamestowniensis]KTD07276.1 hypothetical protein Ljam_1471 [Legionella jamestowniensis]SFL95298.1 hypothetical protein SAMN02746073_2744 [Legionella jamestowniensis DSM 19215]